MCASYIRVSEAAYPAERRPPCDLAALIRHATDPYSLVYTINVAFVPYEELARMDPCSFVMF